MTLFEQLQQAVCDHANGSTVEKVHRAILDVQKWWTETSERRPSGTRLGERCTAINKVNRQRCKRRDTHQGLCPTHSKMARSRVPIPRALGGNVVRFPSPTRGMTS